MMTIKELKDVLELMDDDAIVVVDSEGRSKADSAYMAEHFGEKAVVISGC